MFKRNFILLLLTMTVVIVLINSTNNDELEIVSVSNINDGIVLEDLKQFSNLNSNEQFVILNIWASWCIPCQNEVSELKILSETQGYSVIGILVEDSEENGKEFIINNDISYDYGYIFETISIVMSYNYLCPDGYVGAAYCGREEPEIARDS